MQKGLVKGLKPLFIGQLALLMGICYLLNPLQKQISFAFHEVLHALETPDYIISHDLNSSYEHELSRHSSYSENLNHDHEIVNFIDSVFAASTENDGSEDSMISKVKIDKHITTYQFQLQKCLYTNSTQRIWSRHEDSKLVYLRQLEEPPKFSNNQNG